MTKRRHNQLHSSSALEEERPFVLILSRFQVRRTRQDFRHQKIVWKRMNVCHKKCVDLQTYKCTNYEHEAAWLLSCIPNLLIFNKPSSYIFVENHDHSRHISRLVRHSPLQPNINFAYTAWTTIIYVTILFSSVLDASLLSIKTNISCHRGFVWLQLPF
jgi:hypothetical protein